MGRVIVILLAGLFAARMLPAQPTSAPPSVARIAPSLPTLPPPLPSQTPVDYFRQILDMTPEERDKSLASRSESSRLFLQGKLKEFQALAPAVREARLQTLQLRWLVLPLMKAPADQRPARLKLMAECDRKLVEERLEEWDRLPADLQKKVLENESVIRLFFRSETNAPAADLSPVRTSPQQQARTEQDLARWNALPEQERQDIQAHFQRFFELTDQEKSKVLRKMGDTERVQMEMTLRAFDRLPKTQRELCVHNFQKFAALSPEERQEFLANAERWQSMSAQDRQLWRDLVKRLQPKPPPPPGLRLKAPPLPPGAVPRPPAPTGTARVTN